MAEVDKFKRRVIRAVARILRKDQTPGEEMWKALQNEAGCDCKLLWQRMRALTLKKMKRLILAEDRLDNIAAVAKMTLTDWLLFDLVLVHEDIDVIGQDLKTEPSMLTDLFNVVKRFQIEGKQGDALATAWTAATFYYNSFGRQCSPMLLQRRWYQLKKVTRTNFYKFWFEYRGNARLLTMAKEHQPTKLQSDIAQRYPHLVTMPFLEWDKMIKEKWVILPEEFEAKIKKKNAKPKPATNEPDLVLLEPQIETIDLGVDSEPETEPADADENSKSSNPSNNALNPVALAAAIKKEPEEFEMDFEDEFDAKALEETFIPDDDNAVDNTDNAVDNNDNAVDNTDNAVDNTDNAVDNNDENTVTDVESLEVGITDEVQEIDAMPKICSVAGNFNEDSVTSATEFTDVSAENRNEVMDEINDILKSAAELKKETFESSVAAKSVRIGPKSKVLQHINLDEQPMQVDSTAQPVDIDESDDTFADASSRNEVMTEIDNILKCAAESKKVTREDNIVAKTVITGPKCKKRLNLIESATQPIDIDESDKDTLEGTSSRIEVMTEINNILETAIQGKTQKHKTSNQTIVRDSEHMDVDKSVSEIVQEIIDDDDDDKVEEVTDIKVEETPLEDVIENRTSMPETSSAEHAIDDPSIDIPTDLTFEDDGIELVDDGIAFEEDDDYAAEKIVNVKSENGDSTSGDLENIADSPKFDLKLLMHPCVYTIKLEDMTVFKNKQIDEVKDKIMLETALIESKMYVKQEDIKDLKDDQDNESMKSENNSDNDSSDSEDGIPENTKVKLSSYMLQKPKSRSYNPIQLCKNPDFNTRLKRLTVGFLSSNRNRLLLKCLKPMTIDLSKAFESKLINGTVYLKSDEGPKIKCEKPDDVSEETSVTAVLPSAMPVQSLIDNSSITLQDLLPSPPKPANKSYDFHSERQKTINLPDINNIRRINQHLLTAEVTPMRVQSNEKYIPPVQIIAASKQNLPNTSETYPKTNEFGGVGSSVTNVVATNQVANPEPAPKSKDSANTEAVPGLSTAPGERKRKEYVRPTYSLSWNSLKRMPTKTTGDDEFLLTLDALNKMLHLFHDEDTSEKTKTERAQKKLLIKQKLELQKRMDQFEKKTDDEPNEPAVEEEAKDKKVPKESKKEKKKEEPPSEVVTPKINIVQDKPYAPYCCWARNKIDTEGKKAIRAHQCPRICRCCCRDELAQKFHRPPNSRLVRTVVKPSTIVISDDEETKKVCESIETVVNQSRHVVQVPSLTSVDKTASTSPKTYGGPTRSEVSIQCDMSSSPDFGKMTPAAMVAKTRVLINPKKPRQTEVITVTDDLPPRRISKKPVRVRNDLLLNAAVRSPASPIKHQGHITIDASQRNVQITSEPVHFTAGGHEKILYMNQKAKSKDTASPIFLGENKILLTDVKFPGSNPALSVVQNNSTPPPVPTVPVLPAVPTVPVALPTAPADQPLALPLPTGVQIILLPDGQLTYTVDPGAKLTDEEIATLPVILDAIRQQLNATSATNSDPSTSSEVVNLTDEGNTDALPPASNSIGAAQVDITGDTTASADVVSNLDTVADTEIESGNKTTIEQDKQISSDDPSNIEKANVLTENSNENQLRDIQVTNQVDAASTNEENATNAASENVQLSTDVLESTSISSAENVSEENETVKENETEKENTTPLQNTEIVTGDETINVSENTHDNPGESTNTIANSNRKTLLSDLMEMSGISEEDIQTNVPATIVNTTVEPTDLVAAAPVLDTPIVIPDDPQGSSSDIPRVTAGSAMPSIPELTPITSFSQLKYACEHNGRFFKLDLQLGTLTKIAVCIKKNKPRQLPPLHMIQKSVIDLTEDQDQDEATKAVQEIQTKRNQDVTLDEMLPTHMIKTNQHVVTLNEEVLPASVIRTNRSLLKSNNLQADTVKPLKLFRAIRILKKGNKDSRIPLKITPKLGRGLPETVSVHVKQKRKQELDQSNTRAELPTQVEVDESSLDSAELDQYIWKDSEPISDSDDDTSDDEPLASKAKRMRVNESQKVSSGDEIEMEPAVARPEDVTILEEVNPSETAMEVVNIERLACEKEITEEDLAKRVDTAKEAHISEEVDMAEEADLPEEVNIADEANIPEEAEIAGVEEVPIEDDLNLVPALQVVEQMDEDEDDGDCILGF